MKNDYLSEDIKNKNNDIRSIEFYEKLLNFVPQFAALLNDNNEIVFSNKNFLKYAGAEKPEDILGKRPGETLYCDKICDTDHRCGTTEACKYCGTFQAITQSRKELSAVDKECRLTSLKQGERHSMDFKVTAVPIEMDGESFTMLSLVDISDQKRKEVLERIFFHDIINSANGLNGYVQILESMNLDNIQDIVRSLKNISTNLIEDIVAQRDLLAAERGDLHIENSLIETMELLNYSIEHAKHLDEANKKNIILSVNCEKVSFFSDAKLLKRIMMNLIKNALEASSENEFVEISSYKEDSFVVFSVKNNFVMSDEVKYQIFQRNYSTKGKNRGLGTYSVRLLTESYLGGEVSFSSVQGEGTVFYIKLPLK